jgi:hypothetical protein
MGMFDLLYPIQGQAMTTDPLTLMAFQTAAIATTQAAIA